MTDFLPPDEDLLLRYLDNELPQAEREGVERRAEQDPLFRERLQALQLAARAVRLYGIKDRVASIHGEMRAELLPPQKAKVVSFRPLLRKALAVAAVFLLLLAGVAGYLYSRLNREVLYEEAWVPYTVSVTRGNETTNATPIREAYRIKAYAEVIRLAGENKVTNARDAFLTGMAYLNGNEPAKALTWFEKAEGNGDEELRQDSEYYRALALLRAKQYKAALQVVKKIRGDANHPYREQFSSSFTRNLNWLDWKE